MLNKQRSFILVSFLLSATMLHAAEAPGSNITVRTNNGIVQLEQEYKLSPRGPYLLKAMHLLEERFGIPEKERTSEHFTSQLDLAAGVLFKGVDWGEFGSDASSVRCCVEEITRCLATVEIHDIKSLENWPELRARFARLLMYQRAIWVRLRDPTLDDKTIQLYSGIDIPPRPVDTNAVDPNIKIELQHNLKRFLTDTGPAIDNFMVTAFSTAPADFRMLNELLAMGLYTPSERTKLVKKVADNIPGLPDIVKMQLL